MLFDNFLCSLDPYPDTVFAGADPRTRCADADYCNRKKSVFKILYELASDRAEETVPAGLLILRGRSITVGCRS